tara:strand:+ start:2689 stop:3168 length:480 start_codon:yes stop_codon:yes gene_type:complete
LKNQDEPERLSHEWHAREADESAAYYDRVQSRVDDGDVERDLAAKLRQASRDAARVEELERKSERLDCGHDGGMGWEDRTIAGDVQDRCAMCDCESMANAGVRKARQIEELRKVLVEVMSWISNWSPRFAEEDEWDETKAKFDAALDDYEPPTKEKTDE